MMCQETFWFGWLIGMSVGAFPWALRFLLNDKPTPTDKSKAMGGSE